MIITVEKFLDAWDKYPATKMERFYFKHFSKSAENNKLSWIVAGILFIPFLMGYIGTIMKASYNFIKVATLTFTFMLVAFAIPRIYIWYAHNIRIRKIIKYLGCTMEEYEIVEDKFGHLVK